MQHLKLQKVIKDIDTIIKQRDFFTILPYLEEYKSTGFSEQEAFKLSCLIKFEQPEELQYSIYMLTQIKNILKFNFDIDKMCHLINNLNHFFQMNIENMNLNDENSEYFYSVLDRIVNIFDKTYLELLSYGFNQEESFDIASNLEYNILLEDNIDDIYINFILKVFEVQIFNTLNTINLNQNFFVTIDMEQINQENLKQWFQEFIKNRSDLVFFFTNSLKSLNI